MSDHDDDLPAILGAWQPPAPRAGLADAVIARLHAPRAAAALEPPAQPRRAWLVAIAGALAAVAGVTIALASRDDAPDGELLAAYTQHLELDLARTRADRAATATTVGELERHVAALEQRIDDVTAQLAVGGPAPPPASKHAPAPAKPPATSCDADALKAKGDVAVQSGMDAQALASYEQAMACKPDPRLDVLAYMAACHVKNATKARLYFRRLTDAKQQAVEQICIREGITPTEPAPPCDAAALKVKGDADAQNGMDGSALNNYERAQSCRPDRSLDRLLFMEACKSKSTDKAKRYWKKLTPEQRSSVRQICIRNGVTELP